MNRLLLIQEQLLAKIAWYEKQPLERDYPLVWEKVHLASCAAIGRILAARRQVDEEMAAIACAVHDFGRLVTGKQAQHAEHGYAPVRDFLQECGQFTTDEIEMLAQAARRHSNKGEIGTPLEEIVKDADVLDCYQYGQALARPEQQRRLQQVQAELGLGPTCR